jgi:hypothetical protein
MYLVVIEIYHSQFLKKMFVFSKMKMNWILIVIVLFVLLLSINNFIIDHSHQSSVGGRNNYGDFGQMCHKMASDNCRVPTVTLNDCWINKYQKCIENGGSFLKCSDRAHADCQSSNAPGKQCYNGVYKQCMAGR